jgi:hypothetical protein
MLACGGIREDEFDCEDAAAHLTLCCPDFMASGISCQYVAPVGCNDASYPQLDVGTSKCILGTSCDSLRANGTCAAASALSHDNQTSSALCQ